MDRPTSSRLPPNPHPVMIRSARPAVAASPALLAILLALPSSAQANVQIIHNAPDPLAAEVDVYVNGDLVLDDFAFRSATPFLELPANTDLDVGVAASTSTGPADALFSRTLNLADGSYQLVATGLVDPDAYAPNPDGLSTEFQLLAVLATSQPVGEETVAVCGIHGSPDAPTVDVRAGGDVLIDDLSYADVSEEYSYIDAGEYTLTVTTADGQIVQAFQADLSDAPDDPITVLASGFLTPADDNDGPAFGLLVVFADGTTALLPAAAADARVQVIHNAPDPAAAEVDVYVNGALTLDDFAFRTATPFLSLPADTDLTVAVAPGTSEGVGDALYSETFNLPAGSSTQLVATGVLDPDDFAGNPDGISTAFRLLVGAGAQEASASDDVAVRVVHGSPDAPTVDVRTGGSVLVDDASYLDVTGYLPVAPARYDLDVTTADGAPVASFRADLAVAGGGAVTVLASGFLDPAANQGGPALGLLAAFADGTTALLPVATATEGAPGSRALTLGFPAPNPTAGRARIAFALDAPGRASVGVYDVMGRLVATLADGEYGTERVEVDLDSAALAAGAYVVRLDAASGVRTRVVTVVR